MGETAPWLICEKVGRVFVWPASTHFGGGLTNGISIKWSKNYCRGHSQGSTTRRLRRRGFRDKGRRRLDLLPIFFKAKWPRRKRASVCYNAFHMYEYVNSRRIRLIIEIFVRNILFVFVQFALYIPGHAHIMHNLKIVWSLFPRGLCCVSVRNIKNVCNSTKWLGKGIKDYITETTFAFYYLSKVFLEKKSTFNLFCIRSNVFEIVFRQIHFTLHIKCSYVRLRYTVSYKISS